MIGKLSNMRNSIFTKLILTVTALSFVSLFGVSGYITTANNNKTVIKVDNVEISQSEFNFALQRELAKLRAILGANIDSEDNNIKNELANELLKSKLNGAIIDNTMNKFGIDFSENLVRNVILLNPQFSDNGKFDKEAFKWYLQKTGMSEREFVTEIKRNLARKVILESQVAGAKVPQIEINQMKKVAGQRRIFKYIDIKKDEAKIDRQPSEEELNQYYDDFSEEFTVPEKRDITMLYVSLDDIAANTQISDEEIEAYYKEHIDEFEQPEQRSVQQMLFTSKEQADEAYSMLQNGEDFADVAAKFEQKDIDLGLVSADQLMSDLSEKVFSMENGSFSEPIEINEEWQIVKVLSVKPASKTDRQIANQQIVANLKEEKAYDGSYEIVSDIEDKLGAETSLESIAESYNIPLIDVKGVTEDGTSESKNLNVAQLLGNGDVIDAIFSYSEGETSQTVEDDMGIVVVKINKINESHVAPKEQVSDKIKQIWIENEKSSIVQELVDNIEHDLDAGDTINDVANRYGLALKKTMPISRGENFDNLQTSDISSLFAQPKNEKLVIKNGDDFVVALTSDIYDDSSSLKESDINTLTENLKAKAAEIMSDALLKNFAESYKVEVNYNRAGLTD